MDSGETSAMMTIEPPALAFHAQAATTNGAQLHASYFQFHFCTQPCPSISMIPVLGLEHFTCIS
jgi:hypothetical protein